HLNEIQCAKIVKKRQNALDFQLSSYLGFLIHKAVCDQKLADTQFFIVSKDTGYDYVESFWEETPFVKNLKITPDITRVENIQKALTPPKPKTSAEQQKKIDAVMKEETTPQGFNNALVKEFGSEQAGEFYKANKAKFKEMHKQIT
ncbi:MAG: hypothetical protein LBM70_10660, partial [Victivallales bacterium]|nr:hypothetical protein [Victivallales bacterium]